MPLPILDDIQVASPCRANWDDMVGGERVRFCAACQKNVFNLSAMKRSEAQELVQATEGKICARFYRRADGTMLTSDCPVGVALVLKRARRMAVSAMATSVGAVAAVLAIFAGAPLVRRITALTTTTTVSTTTTLAPEVVTAVPVVPPPTTTPEIGPPVSQPMMGGIRYMPPSDRADGHKLDKKIAKKHTTAKVKEKKVEGPVLEPFMGDIDSSALVQ